MFGFDVCFGCVYGGVLLWILVLSDCGFECEFAFAGFVKVRI